MWIGPDGDEVIERIERLEALLGMWAGGFADPRRWSAAEAHARRVAREAVEAMVARAMREERAGLERQVAAAKLRLTREVGRLLLCLVPDAADLNQAFYDQQTRDIALADRLRRVHALIGYPEWAPAIVAELRGEIAILSVNQQKNVLIGSPLDAALDDPRWQAATALSTRFTE